ncbi:MAG TPA: DUF992 domain-containing protein [Lichenihabitans sp.]|jgi:hypothetical protein|nr:DUF992 domain-containing protein [Lichenihabitans sp.]
MDMKTTIAVGGTMMLALTALPQAASAGPLGQLVCNVAGGAGLLITSKRALNCEYDPANGAHPQHYVGTIGRFGLDLGIQGPGRLVWDVVTVGGPIGPGSLAGTYSGGSASATVGVGVGANALVGGNHITLQPLSVQQQSGLNVAAGIGTMVLEYAP